jgi:hypothetical protein
VVYGCRIARATSPPCRGRAPRGWHRKREARGQGVAAVVGAAMLQNQSIRVGTAEQRRAFGINSDEVVAREVVLDGPHDEGAEIAVTASLDLDAVGLQAQQGIVKLSMLAVAGLPSEVFQKGMGGDVAGSVKGYRRVCGLVVCRPCH